MEEQNCYINVSNAIQGAVKVVPGQKPEGVPVRPGERIWLTREERILTARGPQKREDNPLENGAFKLDADAHMIGEAGDRSIGEEAVPVTPMPAEPVELVEPVEEHGAPSEPQMPAPPQGSRPPAEETGTPAAAPTPPQSPATPGSGQAK